MAFDENYIKRSGVELMMILASTVPLSLNTECADLKKADGFHEECNFHYKLGAVL